MEFVLVFPVLLFLVLTLLQVTLLMVGNVFVHYGAFAATRAAASQVPADLSGLGGEARNEVVAGPGSPKLDAVRRAAWFAVMPVCGPSDSENEGVDTEEFVDALREYLSASGQGEPNWVETLAAGRLRYAIAHTRVALLRTTVEENGEVAFEELPSGGPSLFGPLDPVTAEVEHDFFLSVPYVWRMFADGELGDQHGGYARVTSRYTLGNEGIDPAMPPEPRLPRDDP